MPPYRRRRQMRRARPYRRHVRRNYRRPVRRRCVVRRRPIRRRPMRRARHMGTLYPSYATTHRQRAPTFRQLRSGEIEVIHHEYIGDLISGVATGSQLSPFTSFVFDINPGLATYSFLSALASNYELYDFKHFVITLKTLSGSALNSTNTALGSMGISILYNSTSLAPNSKYQAESYQGATSGVPFKTQNCRVMCRHGRNPLNVLYTRTGAVPSGQDQRLYDLGQVVVWSQGLQTTVASSLAEIWVSYSCVCKDPRTYAGQLALNNLTSYYENTLGTLVTSSNLFAGLVANSNNSQVVTFPSTMNNTIVFPTYLSQGNYMVQFSASNANVPANNTLSSVTFVGTSCQSLNIFPSALSLNQAVGSAGGSPYLSVPYNSTGGNFMFSHGITINANSLAPAQVNYKFGSGSFTGCNASCLLITPINGNVTTLT